MKFIIVTGGVLSGLGKGITASSIGRLLIGRGLKVTAIKIDPYLNCDAGTMNPFQHGEVFVLDDGSEVDLDLGNYERFLGVNLTTDHNITTGKVYRKVIEKERRGDYLGDTVQIIPHITDDIKYTILRVTEESNADVCIVELGGTVGDIESAPFLEAVRQLKSMVGGDENCIFIHTTLVPVLSAVGEQKTKPTQHSVKELRAIGITPDVIVARSDGPLEHTTKKKISLFCDVPTEAVISAYTVPCIYEVPRLLESQGLTNYICHQFNLNLHKTKLEKWDEMVNRIKKPEVKVKIALVGKYTHLCDSYISHVEAFNHAGAELKAQVEINWIEAEEISNEKERKLLEESHAVLIPGGFGDRGIQGKISAATHARENKVPFLGVCLGFQLAIVEFARNVLGMEDANSTEFNKDSDHPVIALLPEQEGITDMGATMRLGAHNVKLQEKSVVAGLYGRTDISERHRHRYEVNLQYIDKFEENGLHFTGKSLDGIRMEVAELDDHPYFMASQFHPEFKSRPGKPSPLHLGLVKAAVEYKDSL